MNFLSPLIISFILGGTFTVLSDLAKADGLISNFQLNVCNALKTKCLRINSTSAESGDLKPIYYLKTFDLDIFGFNKNENLESLKNQKGYVDFASNQLVIRKVEKDGSLNERVFNLSTLNDSVFITK